MSAENQVVDTTVHETIPQWATVWNPQACEIHSDTTGGFVVISNELQCSIAHSKSREALAQWLGRDGKSSQDYWPSDEFWEREDGSL